MSNCTQIVNNCDCDNSCPLTLDFKCILYHKSNQSQTQLDGLNMSNGTTLEVVIEALDEQIKQLNLINHTMVYLRTKYTINTLTQFTNSVSQELAFLDARISALEP